MASPRIPRCRKTGKTITPEFLRSVLKYNRNTGVFTWRTRSDVPQKWNTRWAGKTAGENNAAKYIQIVICYRRIYTHRAAWAYVTGQWPKHDLDHKNGNRKDNRWDNLRNATRTQNARNAKKSKRNSSGYKGVSLIKHLGRWGAQIRFKGRAHRLGIFDTPISAHRAYCRAADKFFGKFARHA